MHAYTTAAFFNESGNVPKCLISTIVRFVSLYGDRAACLQWRSHKNVLLRLKAWHTELDTYTQYVHIIAHK